MQRHFQLEHDAARPWRHVQTATSFDVRCDIHGDGIRWSKWIDGAIAALFACGCGGCTVDHKDWYMTTSYSSAALLAELRHAERVAKAWKDAGM